MTAACTRGEKEDRASSHSRKAEENVVRIRTVENTRNRSKRSLLLLDNPIAPRVRLQLVLGLFQTAAMSTMKV